MGVDLQGHHHGGVPEQGGHRFGVHAGHRSGGEDVPEVVEAVVGKACPLEERVPWAASRSRATSSGVKALARWGGGGRLGGSAISADECCR